MKTRLFITGTDTGVGKTAYASDVLKGWMAVVNQKQIAYVKPFQAGGDGDDEVVLDRTGLSRAQVHVFRRYKRASSIHLAASSEGKRVRFGDVVGQTKQLIEGYTHVVIEGAGGLLVPIEGKKMMIDFIAEIGIPVVLVGRLGLGTLNHTFMSVRILKEWRIPMDRLVLNAYFGSQDDLINQDNVRTLRRWTGLPIEVFPVISSEASA